MTGFGFLVSIFGLGLLIFIHELGHFLVGKALKLKITEFYLGLPIGRPMVQINRRETSYGIKPVLFGGYVKFPEFLAVKDPAIDNVQPRSPAAAAGIKKGDEIRRINDRDFEDWLKFHELIKSRPGQHIALEISREEIREVFDIELGSREGAGWLGIGPIASDNITIEDLPMTLEGQSVWRKALVVAAGPTMNLLLAVVLIAGALMIGLAEPTTTVGKVFAGSPAARVGIETGDRIVGIKGRKTARWADVVALINKSAGDRVGIVVVRNGRKMVFKPKLRKKSTQGLLGIGTKTIRRSRGPVESVKEGFVFIYQASGVMLKLIAKLVTNPRAVIGQIRSPIGVVSETAPIAQRDILEYVLTLAGISVAIGVFNLLPIPPLDGGRIFVSGVEFIIRRPMPKESLAFVNVVGLSLLLMLMTYVIVADVFRLAVPGG